MADWDPSQALYLATRHVKKLGKRGELAPLTTDEASAIHLYTQGMHGMNPKKKKKKSKTVVVDFYHLTLTSTSTSCPLFSTCWFVRLFTPPFSESLLYVELNSALRARDRSLVKAFFSYLKILLRGLHKLDPIDDTVHRGVKKDLSVSSKMRNKKLALVLCLTFYVP